MNEKIYCKSGGCSAKLGAKKLSHILEKIDSYKDSNVLVGFDSRDDAAVYQIDENHAFVSTLDFFPPMVEDPYLYGQIAATNALSDIYAMNGTPKTALNIVCFPDNEDLNILGKIIEGGNSKLVEAECALAGGHSIRDDSIKYGLSVTGLVNPKDVKKNNGTQCGDVLILTKPLGVGLTLNALRMNDCSKEMQERVFKSMTTLNKYACDVLKKYDVHALTDVTGFGLLVHLNEMLDEKNSAVIYKDSIPYFDDCQKYVEEFYLSGAAQTNRNSVEGKISFDCDFFTEEILFDPQTSGGLLASVSKADLEMLEKDFKENNFELYVVCASNVMGSDPDLGAILMKSFIFSLTKQDVLPDEMIFYNEGVKITTTKSETLVDLKYLADNGVEIVSCGTCLDFFHLKEELQVGLVTNMYDIVERMEKADKIIKP